MIGLILATTIACSPKDPEDTDTSSGGSSGSTSTPGSSSSSGEAPTTGTADASSGSESATGTDTGTSTGISTGTSIGTSTGTSTGGDSTTTGGDDSTTGEPATGTSDGSDDTGPVVACDGAGASNLDGVCIVFPPQPDSFTLAELKAGVEFAYVVVVTTDVAGVTSEPLVTCAEPGSSGLFVRETVSDGAEQNYCVCDAGLCMEPPPVEITLVQGDYPALFPWDGVNWNGPSDTNNPKGKPFPPGTYTVKVIAVGKHGGEDYEVTGELPITITK